MKPLPRLCWALFAVVAVALSAFYFVAAWHLFPAMGQDSASHIAPVLNYKAGHGFGSVAWPLSRDYDPTGQHRFLQYPPGFHLVLAALIQHPSLVDVYLCLAGLAVVSLVLYGGLLISCVPPGTARNSPAWVALACVSLVGISTWLYQLPSAGRPEALATPLLLLGALAVLSRPADVWQALIAGVFIGLLAATQIAAAALGGLLYSLYLSQTLREVGLAAVDWRRWLRLALVSAAASLAVFALCLLLSPLPFWETLRGIAAHLRQLKADHVSLAYALLFPATSGTFYGLFFAVVLVHFLWKRGRFLGWLGALNLGIFLVATWSLALHNPTRCYNLLLFTPLFAVYALTLLAEPSTADSKERPALRQTWMLYTLYFGVFALMSVGLLRQIALYRVFRQHGVSYEEAKQASVQKVPSTDSTPVLFDSGVFPLLNRYDHAYQRLGQLDQIDPVPDATKPRLVLHQWYGRYSAPPSIQGYHLVWDDFSKEPPPKVLGVKVATSMPGYAFAIYESD